MSHRVLTSYEMIAEEEEEEEEEKEIALGEVDDALSSWEVRAEQLFGLCDRECKGFITKRDLQRLWGELPLGPDELEGVFDSLDQDENGFLTLQEFTDGFGQHLGLVVEFRADYDSPKNSGEEENVNKEDEEQSGAGSCSITSQQIDDILSCFAKHDFNISSAVVEAVWREVCQEEEQADESSEDSGLGRLVTALLQELSRVKTEHTQLEAALNARTEQYNLQVSHLYEELESQLSGERNKVTAERNEKEARALASLEQDVRDRDAAFRSLQEDQAALIERLENLSAADLAGKQENLRLTQHLNKLEEEFSLKEREVEEMSASLELLRKTTKDEKRRRAHQAFKVSEGIALERESLVTQLDLLRTINTQLRDEHDQTDSHTSNRKIEYPDQVTVSAPVAAKRTISVNNTAVVPSILRPPSSLQLTHFDDHNRSLEDTSQSPTDFEHDELYFQNSTIYESNTTAFSELTSSPETSLLQELLQQPSLCTSCGEAIPYQSGEVPIEKPKVTFKKTDSITQTSPIQTVSREQQIDGFMREEQDDALDRAESPDVIIPARKANQTSGTQTELPPGETSMQNCFKRIGDPDVTKTCCCKRNKGKPACTSEYSSTLILYHPEQKSSPPDLFPEKHSSSAYIHTQHKHHSHTYLPIKHLQSQFTNTDSENSQNQNSGDLDGCHLATGDGVNESEVSLANIEGESSAEKTDIEKQKHSDKIAGSVSKTILNQHANGKTKIENHHHNRKIPGSSDEKMNNLQNLRDNIKNYFNDKSQVFGRDNQKGCENVKEIVVAPVTTNRVFKVVFIGDSGVGKTTFIHRASVGEFCGDFGATVGVDYRLMEVCVGGVRSLLQLWDTAGQERYRAITRQYYRKADGIIVMYDVTSERSFLNVADWISSVKEFGDNNMVTAIIGNKKDLQKARKISIDVAYKLSQAHNSLMYECSAVTGVGVKEAMKHLAGEMTTGQQFDIDNSATLSLHDSPKSSSGHSCCR